MALLRKGVVFRNKRAHPRAKTNSSICFNSNFPIPCLLAVGRMAMLRMYIDSPFATADAVPTVTFSHKATHVGPSFRRSLSSIWLLVRAVAENPSGVYKDR